MSGRCWVCESVNVHLLRQLNDLLVEPSRWPAEFQLKLARTESTNERSKLQIAAAVGWLAEHGRGDITGPAVRAHLLHQQLALDTLVEMTPNDPAGATALMAFYAEAINVGRKALRKLDNLLADDDGPGLEVAELLKIAAIGGKYAMSAATLRQRGVSPIAGDEGYVPPEDPEPPEPPKPPDEPKQVTPKDPLDGFLAGSAPRPSKRVGSVRVRTIEGEARPVWDEGPKDREHYNKRADEEGSPRI